MKTSLPKDTNTTASPSIVPAIDKEDELDISALSRAHVEKILARIIDRLNGIERASRDLYSHNYEEAQKDIVKIGDDSYSRANAIGNLNYKAVLAIADVKFLQKTIMPATDIMNNTQSIERNLPDGEKYTETMEDSTRVAFEPIKIFLKSMIETEKHTDISIIGGALCERAYLRLEEIFELVDEQIGVIKLTGATYGNSLYIEGGKLLSARITPVASDPGRLMRLKESNEA